jgi:AcrR family transcriptional regulator
VKSRSVPVISARKRPKQARSERLVADVLEAATRVLARDGARHFTTARVAEAAGVSVGSLYQYFPNKESILFRLQADEWRQTGSLLDKIMTDSTLPPLERLRSLVLAFFRSECDEAQLRVALSDAAPLYRDAPETREHREQGKRLLLAFTRELLPNVPAKERNFAMGLVKTAMSAIGKTVSEEGHARTHVDRLAQATGDMFCAYLEKVAVTCRGHAG